MQKQIIFFDIDGTLVNERKVLFEETKRAIDRLKEKGNYVVLATGRPPFWYEGLREELGINSYISYNGQHVVFEGEVIYENPLDGRALDRLYEEVNQRSLPMTFLDELEMVVTLDRHPFVERCFVHLIEEYPRVSVDLHKKTSIYQALIFTDKVLETRLKNKYSMFDFLRWHSYSYDLLPKGSSKAAGMSKIVEALGGEGIKTYAFGDGANDLEMILKADVGVAMDNGLEEIKQAADYIAADVNEYGLVKALKDLSLL